MGVLHKIPPKNWIRAIYSFFLKNDTSVNSMNEQFNSKAVNYKGKPIITMVKEKRCHIMRGMNNNKHTISTYLSLIVLKEQSKLEQLKIDSMLWTIQWVGDLENSMFEVSNMRVTDKVKVDLNEKICIYKI